MSHRQQRDSGRGLLTVTVLALSLLGISGAWSYFTGNGSGSGTAKTTTTVPLELGLGTPSASLYPGGSSNVDLTVLNSNPFSVRVNRFALDTTRGATASPGFSIASGLTGCGLSFAAQTQSGGWTVPANTTLALSSSTGKSLPNALSMSLSAPSECQNAAITVYLIADPGGS